MLSQNKIFDWVRDHRVHHKYTETPADPHDSKRGFWFSHVGWLMLKKRPEVIEKGNQIDMSDILNDPVVQFFDRYFFTYFFLTKSFKIFNVALHFRHHMKMKLLFNMIIPVFIPIYFFNQSFKWSFITQVFIRYPWSLNFTWSVNSFAHMFGYRPYDK